MAHDEHGMWIQDDIPYRERLNSCTSLTKHKEFEENGYFTVKDFYDPQFFYELPPKKPGKYDYNGDVNLYNYNENEGQVKNSTSRTKYPPYESAHTRIRYKLEKLIGKKLYNTYFYDRFYVPGYPLTAHTDRPACEISVTLHISSNVKDPWPIWIKGADTYDIPRTKNPWSKKIIKQGLERSVILKPGDALIYKGCERPHWREPLPREYRTIYSIQYTDDITSIPPKVYSEPQYGMREEIQGIYYHQIFFHYVLQDGERADKAWDNNDCDPMLWPSRL